MKQQAGPQRKNPMRLSLKTKISTPAFLESIDFYRQVFDMQFVEQWDSENDRGAILAFADTREEAFLEIYHDEKAHDFSGLGLQFRVESLESFIEKLPSSVEYQGPEPRPWGSTYLFLRDPNDISVIVYEGGN